jgi:hypothetical protein
MIELLAALSASAAAGIKIAIPLLLGGLLEGDNLWSDVPLLSKIPPRFTLVILISWSLVEVFAAKKLLGQRVLQIVQLLFSPIVGAILAIAAAKATEVPTCLIGVIGGFFAFVLQLVQAGWFYRWRGLPMWIVFIQDCLCISLTFFAFKAPQLGGLIALILLGLAFRSYKELHRWYLRQSSDKHHQP